jgi:phenylalanyl-tRNA synthetase beta chain
MLVIADAERPIALAGVMGGEESEVTDGTTRPPPRVRALRRPPHAPHRARLGLSTDASYRFERGVDPELQPLALRRLVALIRRSRAARVDARRSTCTPVPRPAGRRRSAPSASPGARRRDRRAAEIAALLEADRLRQRAEDGGALRVRGARLPPRRDARDRPDRGDRAAARLRQLPGGAPAVPPGRVPDDPLVGCSARCTNVSSALGLPRGAHRRLRAGRREPRAAAQPALLRGEPPARHLGHGLLRRVEHNWAHGARDVRLYEIGSVFFPRDGHPAEEVRVAIVLHRCPRPPHWSEERAAWDVWDLKALLREMVALLGGERLPPAATLPISIIDGDALEVRADAALSAGGAGA